MANRTLLFWVLLVFPATASAKDSCLECHSALEDYLQTPAVRFDADIHKHRGFGCVDCHGGDATLDDPEASMSPKRGFLGKIKRTEIPKLCARCHSDADLIHRFRPQQRVDQYAQYQTSVHGKRLAEGDTNAATCIDCHSVHDIREVKDPRTPVHPLHLPETCAHCHSDQKRMGRYNLATSQFDDYRQSVHWHALSQRGDLSAPSCASCHGNHGATPPAVKSVAAVCGTCHALMEDLYQKSPHEPAFESMGMAGCVSCHGNHKIVSPSDAMLAGADSLCSSCHEGGSAGATVAEQMTRLLSSLDVALQRSDDILEVARRSGMEVSEALLEQQQGHQALVKARVAVHAFALPELSKPVNEGLAIAARTYQAGVEAMNERRFRRIGLGFSLLAIVMTIAGLQLALHSLEKKNGARSPHGSGTNRGA
ncbi:MAG: cytochrome c3 family protein [Acidobacteriota bacterium]